MASASNHRARKKKTQGSGQVFHADPSFVAAKRTTSVQVARGLSLMRELYALEMGYTSIVASTVMDGGLRPHPIDQVHHKLMVWMARHARKADVLVEQAWPLVSWSGSGATFFWEALWHHRPDLIERALVLAATDPQGEIDQQTQHLPADRAGVLRGLLGNTRLHLHPHMGPVFQAHAQRVLEQPEREVFNYITAWWCFNSALGIHIQKKQSCSIEQGLAALDAILAQGAAQWILRRTPQEPPITLAHALAMGMIGGIYQHWPEIERRGGAVIERLMDAGCSLDGQVDPNTGQWSDGPVETVRCCMDATNLFSPPTTRSACAEIMDMFLSRGADWHKALAQLEPDKLHTRAALLQHPVVRREQLMGHLDRFAPKQDPEQFSCQARIL